MFAEDADEISSRGQYAQDIFTVKTAYFEGQPPKSVNMYWRRFALSSIPIDDPVAFEMWLRARWMEKDGLIEAYYRHGRFPADRGAHKTRDGNIVRGAGHIETEIKSRYWYEFLQIFAPVGLLALVLYTFYNALPKTYTKALNRQSVTKRAGELQRTQINLQNKQLLTNPASDLAAGQDSLATKAMTMYTDLSRNPTVRKVVELPELTSQGLRNEMVKHQPALDTIFTQKNALQDMKTKLPSSRALPPPFQASSQSIKHQNGNSAKGGQAKAPQQNSGPRKTEMPKSKSQQQTPAKAVRAKPSPAKTATAKQSGPPKLPNNRPNVQSAPAPKLKTKPKPAKLSAAATTTPSTK